MSHKTKNRKRKKGKKRGGLSIIDKIVILICVGVMAVCAYKIYKPLDQYRKGQQEYSDVRKKSVTNKKPAGNSDDAKALAKYINFARLKRINKDVIAWIWIPGTGISYPVLKGSTDNFYLRHDLYRRYLYSGSIFMESVCKSDFSSQNTIIYGHNMKDGSMFAMTRRFASRSFMNRHHRIYIYTPDKAVRIYDVFSYNVTTQSRILFTNEPESYTKFIDRALLGASASRKVDRINKQKTVMLSTCYTGHEKYRRLTFGRLEKVVKRS